MLSWLAEWIFCGANSALVIGKDCGVTDLWMSYLRYNNIKSHFYPLQFPWVDSKTLGWTEKCFVNNSLWGNDSCCSIFIINPITVRVYNQVILRVLVLSQLIMILFGLGLILRNRCFGSYPSGRCNKKNGSLEISNAKAQSFLKLACKTF